MADNLSKRDLDIIIEVNKKAIEMETEVAGQNEEIISSLNEMKGNQEHMITQLDEVSEKCENNSRDLFKIQVLFVSGLVSLVIQIIQLIKTIK